MSYGAIQQLLVAGLSDPDTLLKAVEQWPDKVKRAHSLIALHAFEFTAANMVYMKAQQDAMDALTATSQARLKLHNAIVDWQRALDEHAAKAEGGEG